jgi:hypothetical protein
MRLVDLIVLSFWLWLLSSVALGAEQLTVRIVETDSAAERLIGIDAGARSRAFLERSSSCAGYPPLRIKFVDAYDSRATIRVRLVQDRSAADLVLCVRQRRFQRR